MDEFSKSTIVGGKPKSRIAPWEMPRSLRAGQRQGLVMLRGLVGGEGSRIRARRAGNPETEARKGLDLGKEEAAWRDVGAASSMHLSAMIITLGAWNWPRGSISTTEIGRCYPLGLRCFFFFFK